MRLPGVPNSLKHLKLRSDRKEPHPSPTRSDVPARRERPECNRCDPNPVYRDPSNVLPLGGLSHRQPGREFPQPALLFFGFRNIKAPRLRDRPEGSRDILAGGHKHAPDDHARSPDALTAVNRHVLSRVERIDDVVGKFRETIGNMNVVWRAFPPPRLTETRYSTSRPRDSLTNGRVQGIGM